MRQGPTSAQFEHEILPHLGAAYNLARWLTRDQHDAQDVVQEALVRALRYFDRFRGGDSRPWFLAIVRNTCFSWLEANRKPQTAGVFDEEIHTVVDETQTPEASLIRSADRERIEAALREIPPEWREVLVLREIEGLSYKEIAGVADIPIGTVMSRLARARKRMSDLLTGPAEKEMHSERR